MEYLLRPWLYSSSLKIIIEHYEKAEFVGKSFSLWPVFKDVDYTDDEQLRSLGIGNDVKSGSFLDDQRLGEAQLSQNYNLILLGVVDREMGNEFIFRLSGIDHKLDPSDLLVVIGAADEIERLKKDISCQ